LHGELSMSSTLIIFGASGDLTRGKLVPALYRLHRKGGWNKPLRVVGFSRTAFAHDAWRSLLAETTAQAVGSDFEPSVWDAFAAGVYYHRGDIARLEDFESLRKFVEQLEGDGPSDRVFYLATAPQFFEPAIAGLGAAGLNQETRGASRVVVEKPFGTNRQTARQLNQRLHEVFDERQIFRIDHYLGKETVQNILVLRFANAIFEPLWNRHYIRHVEITAAEERGVGDRAEYYDSSGVLRDMFQNHLMQLLTFTAMEPPVRFEADTVRNEKVKVLQAIRPYERPEEVAANSVRGQYLGYLNEPRVPPGSQTATFGAVKLLVDNWRWQGVPFFLRSGKAMDCRTTQIVIQFHPPPHVLFDTARRRVPDSNRLLIQIQPAEGIQVHFLTKVPDAGMQLRQTELDFRFGAKFDQALPDAYERLLLDVLLGDASLFARSDEVELSWSIIDPIVRAWEEQGVPELALYEPGQWGPQESSKWIWSQGYDWLDQCPVLR
jgi:glucose-6-phosphate 1-dehydrogenase